MAKQIRMHFQLSLTAVSLALLGLVDAVAIEYLVER